MTLFLSILKLHKRQIWVFGLDGNFAVPYKESIDVINRCYLSNRYVSQSSQALWLCFGCYEDISAHRNLTCWSCLLYVCEADKLMKV